MINPPSSNNTQSRFWAGFVVANVFNRAGINPKLPTV